MHYHFAVKSFKPFKATIFQACASLRHSRERSGIGNHDYWCLQTWCPVRHMWLDVDPYTVHFDCAVHSFRLTVLSMPQD